MRAVTRSGKMLRNEQREARCVLPASRSDAPKICHLIVTFRLTSSRIPHYMARPRQAARSCRCTSQLSYELTAKCPWPTDAKAARTNQLDDPLLRQATRLLIGNHTPPTVTLHACHLFHFRQLALPSSERTCESSEPVLLFFRPAPRRRKISFEF